MLRNHLEMGTEEGMKALGEWITILHGEMTLFVPTVAESMKMKICILILSYSNTQNPALMV